jgi:hypothetical protein
MGPVEFISSARKLGRNQDEASLRSAASRAYHGAFHFAGEKLEQLTANSASPFEWSRVYKNHRQLRDQWAARWGQAGQTVANFLLLAHELRKKADYDLHLVFTLEDKNEAFQFVAQALLAVRRVR